MIAQLLRLEERDTADEASPAESTARRCDLRLSRANSRPRVIRSGRQSGWFCIQTAWASWVTFDVAEFFLQQPDSIGREARRIKMQTFEVIEIIEKRQVFIVQL